MALCLLQSLRRARPASGRCVSHAAYCDRPASGNVLRDRWESGGHDKKRLEARQHQVIMSIIKLCLQSILRDPNSIPQEPWSLRDTLADWCNLCKSIIKLLLTRPCAESVAVVSAVSYEPSPNIELRIAFNHHPIHPNFSNVAKQRSPNLDCVPLSHPAVWTDRQRFVSLITGLHITGLLTILLLLSVPPNV